MHPSRPSRRRRPCPSRRLRQAGFTLVELMIASAIGLVILAGMASLFVSNSKIQAEIEKANRQVENGRYGIELLSTDLTNAGFYGELDPSALPPPTALPDACATDLASLSAALPLAVQGVDQADASSLSCISTDLKPNTDVVVVRRTETCVAGTGNCAGVADGGVFLQASLCNNSSELGSSTPTDFYNLDSDPTKLTRHMRDCSTVAGTGTAAVVRRYLVHIYYITNNDNPGDGIPTLKRAELGGPDKGLVFTEVPLVEGIENMQLEYGMGNGVFSAAPADWSAVIAVKLNLLARNIDQTIDYTDTKSYTLGRDASGAAIAIAAANDHYKRHVFQSQVILRNPAGRKAP